MKYIFTSFNSFIHKPLLLAFTLLAMSSNAWGQTYNGGAWYSLYDATEYSKSTAAGGEIHTYSGAFLPHDGTFSFDSKLPGKDSYEKINKNSSKISDPKEYGVSEYNIEFGGKSCSVALDVSSSYSRSSKKILGTTFYTHKYTYTYNYSHITGSGLSASSTSFSAKYIFLRGNRSRTVYIKNVKIPLAKHILLDNGGNGTTSVTKTFANTSVENYSDPIAINLRSFLTNADMTVKLTSGDKEVFRLGEMDNTTGALTTSAAGKTYNVGENACASANGTEAACAPGKLGKIDNYSFNVYFYPKAATTYNGTITITDGTSTATITLKGTGLKREQTISWLPSYSADKPVINVEDEVTLASASSGLTVTYSSSNPSIAEVTAEGTMILGKGKGDVTITASQAGNDKWKAATSISKTFTVTDKIRQTIAWTQNLSKLDPDALTKTVTLTAVVMAIDDETGELEEVPAQTAKIKYAITGATGIATISGNTLTYSATEGSTTITATVDEDETYAAAVVSKPVRVRRTASGCEDPLIPTNLSGEYEFFQMNANEITKEITIDRSQGDPDKLTFEHKGEKWAACFYGGTLEVYQFVNGAWSAPLGSVTPTVGEYKSSPEIQLNRNATKIKIVRPKGGTGYHYINNVEITRAQFIESTTKAINLGHIARLDEQDKEVIINYSNCKSDLTVSHNDAQLALLNGSVEVTKIELGECGEVGSYTMNVKLIPTEPGSFTDNIVVKDAISGTQFTIPVTATVAKSDQTINWTQVQEVETTDNLVLSATASSGLSVSYEVVTGSEVATVNSTTGEVTIIKDGIVTFRATQAGDKYFNAAEAVERTFTISKVTPAITVNPSASSVLLPATLSASTLTGGEATVEGSFTWQNTATAIERNNTGYTVVFTPSNTNWYTTQTCTVVVGIEKYVPTVTSNELTGSAITYGQALSSSTITGNIVVTDIIPEPNETIEGTYAWKNPSEQPNVSTTTAKAIFTPTDDRWFLPVEIDVPVTINPAPATIAATATIVAGQTLAEVMEFANITTGIYGEPVDGTIVWAEGVDQSSTPEVGIYTYAVSFASANANYANGEGLCTLTVNEGIVFNGNVNDDWDNADNWTGGVPTATDRVVINSDIEMTTAITVAGLTINEGKTVTIKNGGKLIVGDGNSLNRTTYGNIIVEAGGQLLLNEGNVEINDFTLYSTFEAGNPKSGQIRGAAKLNNHGHAYFIIDLDPAGNASAGWYDFTVPFPVNALTGITRSADGETWNTIVNERNYAIMDFHEDLRAQGLYAWKKYRGILQPGVAYTMTIDSRINKYRFEMAPNGAFNTATTQPLQSTNSSEDAGWNGVGNGTMSYITLRGTPVVQMYNHAENAYNATSSASQAFAVGAAYFVQRSDALSELTMDAAYNATNILRAPQREQEKYSEQLTLTLSQNGLTRDNLFVTCSENATDTYTRGFDVQKLGELTAAKVARLWTNTKGKDLCAVYAPYNANEAIIPLQFFAPEQGEYTLSIDRNTEEDIYLTRNGVIIWDMNMSDYNFTLEQGTDNSYALQVIRSTQNVATGAEQLSSDAQRGKDFVEKMIVNGQLFILRDGNLYDAQGKKVTAIQ